MQDSDFVMDEIGVGKWTVYWESKDGDKMMFHHHKFATRKEAERHALDISLAKRGSWITVNYQGQEIASFHQG